MTKTPPINWLLAVMLERKNAKKWTLNDLAAVTGLSPQYLSALLSQDPWMWRAETRSKVCTALGISKEVQIDCFARQ